MVGWWVRANRTGETGPGDQDKVTTGTQRFGHHSTHTTNFFPNFIDKVNYRLNTNNLITSYILIIFVDTQKLPIITKIYILPHLLYNKSKRPIHEYVHTPHSNTHT